MLVVSPSEHAATWQPLPHFSCIVAWHTQCDQEARVGTLRYLRRFTYHRTAAQSVWAGSDARRGPLHLPPTQAFSSVSDESGAKFWILSKAESAVWVPCPTENRSVFSIKILYRSTICCKCGTVSPLKPHAKPWLLSTCVQALSDAMRYTISRCVCSALSFSYAGFVRRFTGSRLQIKLCFFQASHLRRLRSTSKASATFSQALAACFGAQRSSAIQYQSENEFNFWTKT